MVHKHRQSHFYSFQTEGSNKHFCVSYKHTWARNILHNTLVCLNNAKRVYCECHSVERVFRHVQPNLTPTIDSNSVAFSSVMLILRVSVRLDTVYGANSAQVSVFTVRKCHNQREADDSVSLSPSGWREQSHDTRAGKKTKTRRLMDHQGEVNFRVRQANTVSGQISQDGTSTFRHVAPFQIGMVDILNIHNIFVRISLAKN